MPGPSLTVRPPGGPPKGNPPAEVGLRVVPGICQGKEHPPSASCQSRLCPNFHPHAPATVRACGSNGSTTNGSMKPVPLVAPGERAKRTRAMGEGAPREQKTVVRWKKKCELQSPLPL